MKACIQVTLSNGTQQTFPITETPLTIGSGQDADIVLHEEKKLQPIHLLVAKRGKQCWVSTSRGADLWDKKGQPILSGFMPWGTRMQHGTCFFDIQIAENKQDSKKDSNSSHPGNDNLGELKPYKTKIPTSALCPNYLTFLNTKTKRITLMLFFSTILYFLFIPPRMQEDLSTKVSLEFPVLLNTFTACTSTPPLPRALQAEQEAHYKRENAVFYKQEGIKSISLYAEASDCFQKAGNLQKSQELSEQKNQLLDSMNLQYRHLRIQLDRNMKSGHNKETLVQVQMLLQLLEHHGKHPYRLALQRLQRQLTQNQLTSEKSS